MRTSRATWPACGLTWHALIAIYSLNSESFIVRSWIRGVRHGQKSRTPTSEIKQKSEREIRNQVANLCTRPYTFADLRTRPYTFADCNGNQKLLKLKSGNHLEIQKSRMPDWHVSDPSVGSSEVDGPSTKQRVVVKPGMRNRNGNKK